MHTQIQAARATFGPFRLRVLLLVEDGHWVAQCIDFDIAAQGKSVPEAKRAFEIAFVSQIIVDSQAGIGPLSETSPAPARYKDVYEYAQQLADLLVIAPPPDSIQPAPPSFRAEAEFRIADLVAMAAKRHGLGELAAS